MSPQLLAAAEMMAAKMNGNIHWKWKFSFRKYGYVDVYFIFRRKLFWIRARKTIVQSGRV